MLLIGKTGAMMAIITKKFTKPYQRQNGSRHPECKTKQTGKHIMKRFNIIYIN